MHPIKRVSIDGGGVSDLVANAARVSQVSGTKFYSPLRLMRWPRLLQEAPQDRGMLVC